MKEKQFIITQSQAQEIANYLICQPFKDVAKLVGMLTNLQEYSEQKFPATGPIPAPEESKNVK